MWIYIVVNTTRPGKTATGTYGLGIGGEDALYQLVDEVGVGADLVVSEGDPLVDERSLLEVGAEECRVSGEGGD